MALRLRGVQMHHRGRTLRCAEGAAQGDDAGRTVFGADAPGAQSAHIVGFRCAARKPEVQPVGHRQRHIREGRPGFPLAGKADPAGPEHIGYLVDHAVIAAKAQEFMRFDPAQFHPRAPCRVAAADREAGPSSASRADSLSLPESVVSRTRLVSIAARWSASWENGSRTL